MLISFAYNNVSYTVPMEVYDKEKILLPDGRVLKVGRWEMGFPPTPMELEEMGNIHTRSTEEAESLLWMTSPARIAYDNSILPYDYNF